MKNIICILEVVLLLCGCSIASAGTVDKSTTQNVSTTQEVQTLEDWELELLSAVYGTETELEHLRTGELYIYQQKQLSQLRAVMQYLTEKYPGHTFRITDIELRHSTKSSIDYLFTADTVEKNYVAVAAGPESMEFSDNYYAALIGDTYDVALAERLRTEASHVVTTATVFSALLGPEVTGMESPEALLTMGSALPRDTAVYISGTDPEAALEQAREAVESLNIYGAYRLYASEQFQAGMTASECEAIRQAATSTVHSAAVQCYSQGG